jgi:pimeloyl-ACP methyl ester carboxylesterase
VGLPVERHHPAAARGRATRVVPDQIGFGLSAKPHSTAAHSLDHHAANLVALLDALDLRRVVFACHDWGGPTGLAALLTRPHRAAAVAVMSTWAWRQPSAAFHHRVVPWRTMHAPVLGPFLLGRQAAMPGRGIYLSVVDRARYDEDARDAYETVLTDADERRLTWLWPGPYHWAWTPTSRPPGSTGSSKAPPHYGCQPP